jgi:glyoxylase-like metal-dependent hydrolase (beta-lactamase superfamily II)
VPPRHAQVRTVHVVHVQRLIVGWFTCPAWLMRQGEPQGPLTRFPVPAYLVETGEQRILIDTGLNPAAVADATAHYGQSDGMDLFKLEQELTLAEQVDLDSVTMVVLTHLHWDHVGGLPLVPPSIPLVVQRREWEAGHDRDAAQRNFFFPRDYAGERARLTLIDGDHDLLGDGSIELLLTPGHTPGHQSVRIGDDLVVGADVAHFAVGLDDHRFPVFGHSHDEQAQSADRLRGLRDAGLTVLPGHDPDVVVPGPVTA